MTAVEIPYALECISMNRMNRRVKFGYAAAMLSPRLEVAFCPAIVEGAAPPAGTVAQREERLLFRQEVWRFNSFRLPPEQ